MHYVVLDTDVASRVIKNQLGDPLAARLTGTVWCVTFVTVGELWQWATTRSWGPRTREQLEQWLGHIGGRECGRRRVRVPPGGLPHRRAQIINGEVRGCR